MKKNFIIIINNLSTALILSGALVFLPDCGKGRKDSKGPDVNFQWADSLGTGKYECRKTDFYKGAKLDYRPKGKCAAVTEYPEDIPLTVNTDKKSAEKYFKKVHFPGKVSPSAKRETVEVDLNFPAAIWHFPTGAYAAPDEEIELEVPEELVQFNFSLQIGIHTDNISHIKGSLRDSTVHVSRKIENRITRLKNKRGGPVILLTRIVREGEKDSIPWWLVDKEIRENKGGLRKGNYKITLKNVIRAPRFILGKTTPQEWVDEERCNPAPWAELESRYLTIAVPSNAVRNLNNPEPVLNFWDASLESINGLSDRTEVGKLAKERFVADVNHSLGYMHSGYPIMSFMDLSRYVVDQEPKDSTKPWSPDNSALMNDYILGYYHEVGHNRQTDDPWTAALLGETSVNLFVLKANCEVKGFNFDRARVFKRESWYKALRYFSGDRDMFNEENSRKWKNRFAGIAHTEIPNLFYIHLYRHYGFDIYRKIITLYSEMKKENWDRMNHCSEKRELECNQNRLNSFAFELSRITGRDMTDWLNFWGYELTWGQEEVRKLNLPKFEPIPLLAGFPIESLSAEEGKFFDISNLRTDGTLTVNVFGERTEDGAEVGLWQRSFFSENTQFQLKKAGTEKDVYLISGKASGKCIGLDNQEKTTVLRECDANTPALQWKLEEVFVFGLRFHSICSKESGKCLTAPENAAAGSKLSLAAKSEKDRKQFWIISGKE